MEDLKTPIAGLYLRQACELVYLAEAAKSRRLLSEVIQRSIATNLMTAITLEGVINEVGERALAKWQWERFERMDVPFKWYYISLKFGSPFSPKHEPLQTVQRFYRMRNKLAHPKLMEADDEVIMIRRDTVRRNVQLSEKVEGGDTILFGMGKLLDEFNELTARDAIEKTFQALTKLNDITKGAYLTWLDDYIKQWKNGDFKITVSVK